MKNIARLFLFAVLLSSAMIACKNQDEPKPKPEEPASSAEDFARIDYNLNSADEAVADAQNQNSSARLAASPCYTVNWDLTSGNTTSVPGFGTGYAKFTLDFSGNTCDSLVRNGSITVYQSGSYATKNYKDSIVFSGYSTNGQTLNGYKVIEFAASINPLNVIGNYSVNVKATSSAGNTVHLISSGQKVLANFSLPLLAYDQTSGSGQLITSNGTVSIAITKPIVRKSSCLWRSRFPVEGTVTYSNSATSNTATLDFGNGSCDNKATLTENGVTTTITML